MTVNKLLEEMRKLKGIVGETNVDIHLDGEDFNLDAVIYNGDPDSPRVVLVGTMMKKVGEA